VVHGLTIPLGKLGFYIPRTLSLALSTEDDSNSPFHVPSQPSSETDHRGIPIPSGVYRIGRSIIRRNPSANASRNVSKNATPRRTSPLGKRDLEDGPGIGSEEPPPGDEAISMRALDGDAMATGRVVNPLGRSIRFPDETPQGVGIAEKDL
jgi:hypothetical protein